MATISRTKCLTSSKKLPSLTLSIPPPPLSNDDDKRRLLLDDDEGAGAAAGKEEEDNQSARCSDCGQLIPLDQMTDHHHTCFENIVRCANRYRGCDVSGTFDEIFDDHANVCPYNDVKCQHCGMTMLVKDLSDHQDLLKCEAMKRSCRYRCGTVDQRKSDMLIHEANCMERPDKCTFPGCDFESTYGRVRDHERMDTNEHLRLTLIKVNEGNQKVLAKIEENDKKVRKEIHAIFLMIKELSGVTSKLTEQPPNSSASSSSSSSSSYSSLMKWQIPMFMKKVTTEKPGYYIKSPNFEYQAKGSKYPYLLSLRLYPCGTPDDTDSVYLYIKNQGTPNDDRLVWPIPDAFIIAFREGDRYKIENVVERRDQVTGGKLTNKDSICCNVDGDGYLGVEVRVRTKQ